MVPGGFLIRVFAGLAVAASLLAGCGPAAGASDAGLGGDGSFVTCATDPRAVPYQAGMSVMSDGGLLTVKLLSSTPGPPVKGYNTWVLEIAQTDTGVALEGLEVTVEPYMPDHEHSTTPVGVELAPPAAYRLYPVNLKMSGLWEVRMTISGANLAGGTTARAMIPICIP